MNNRSKQNSTYHSEHSGTTVNGIPFTTYRYNNFNHDKKISGFMLTVYKGNSNYHLFIELEKQQAKSFKNSIHINQLPKPEAIISHRLDFLSVDKTTCEGVIRLMHEFDPFDKAILQEVMKSIGITKVPVDIEDLIALIENGKLEEAIQLAEDDDSNTLFKLANACEMKATDIATQWLEHALNCYHQIPSDNPNYALANDKMLHILMKLSTDNLSEEEKWEDLENKFTFSLYSGEINKRSTAQLFNALCGKSLSSNTKELCNDATTLIMLAKEIRTLNQLVEQQENTINQLRKTECNDNQNKKLNFFK